MAPSRPLGDARADSPLLAKAWCFRPSSKKQQGLWCLTWQEPEGEARRPPSPEPGGSGGAALPLPLPSCTCYVCLLRDRTGADSDVSPFPCYLS